MPKITTQIKTEKTKAFYGKFIIEPLQKGFGHTIGNALRRTLLSSLAGTAITQVKIAKIPHEFSTIPGVKEDVVELLLNLKKINFKMTVKKPTIITFSAVGPREIKAGDIRCPTGIEVVNKNHYLATLADKKTKLEIEIMVEYDKGYRLPQTGADVGNLPLDSNFSPVEKVSYQVESTRVGRITNLDRLIMDIYTNGITSPKDALQQAAAILVEQFKIVQGEAELEKLPRQEKKEEKPKPSHSKKEVIYLEELNLPTRVLNTLKKTGIETVEEMQKKGEEEIRQIKNIGPKTIKLILEKVSKPRTTD